MQSELQDRSRFMLFVPAVLITAWYGGVGPGIFALALGAVLCASIAIQPVPSINFGDRAELVGMFMYLFVGAGVIALVHRERMEKKRREAVQQNLEQLNVSLENRVRERTLELEVANKELEGFCYSVSHDLRTPTRAIVGNIRIVLEDVGGQLDDVARQKLGRVSLAALKLSNLVDALLTYARLARAGISTEPVDLCQLITSEARSCAASAGARLHLDIPQELMVTGDKAMLRTAVQALASNAATYHKDGREITLSVAVERMGSDVTVSFRDTGIGFDPKYLPKVFMPFERLHRDEDYPGVGMGLANVVRIAERHNGAVWAESKLGEGSTFHLRLGDQPAMTSRVPELLSA